MQNVTDTSNSLIYKPIWPGDMMYIQVSKWCHIFRKNVQTNHFDTLDFKTPLERGMYNITIEVPHVYIGPHKNGENYSLSMRIVQIVYEPETPPPPPFSFKTPAKTVKKVEKRVRPRKNAFKVEASKAWFSLKRL